MITILNEKSGKTDINDRKKLAMHAFQVSSHYDTAIFNQFNKEFNTPAFKQSYNASQILRYGENPHQEGYFYGNLESVFEKHHGKELSYNNLLDVDAAVALISDFKETTFAIIKHNNACGAYHQCNYWWRNS